MRKGEKEEGIRFAPLPYAYARSTTACSRTIHLEESSQLRLGQRAWRIFSYSRPERRTLLRVGDAPLRTLAPATRPLSYAVRRKSGSPHPPDQDRMISMTKLQSGRVLNAVSYKLKRNSYIPEMDITPRRSNWRMDQPV